LNEDPKRRETIFIPVEDWRRHRTQIQSMMTQWKVAIAAPPPKIAKPNKASASSSNNSKFSKRDHVGGGSSSSRGKAWGAAELARMVGLVDQIGTRGGGNRQWVQVAEELGTGRTPRALMEKWREHRQQNEAAGGAATTAEQRGSAGGDHNSRDGGGGVGAWVQQLAPEDFDSAQQNAQFLAEEKCLLPKVCPLPVSACARSIFSLW
jgi:hypothetical protein